MESRATRAVEEYNDSEAFEIDATAVAAIAYNLGFGDCRKKATNTFPSFDLH